jgi:hypothetical protein
MFNLYPSKYTCICSDGKVRLKLLKCTISCIGHLNTSNGSMCARYFGSPVHSRYWFWNIIKWNVRTLLLLLLSFFFLVFCLFVICLMCVQASPLLHLSLTFVWTTQSQVTFLAHCSSIWVHTNLSLHCNSATVKMFVWQHSKDFAAVYVVNSNFIFPFDLQSKRLECLKQLWHLPGYKYMAELLEEQLRAGKQEGCYYSGLLC